MKRLALLLVLVAALATTSAARSQQPTVKTPAPDKHTIHRDSLQIKPSPELQKSLDELSVAVQALALRIASDPELKAAAMKVASGLVNTAQQVVSEQTVVLQGALKTAAERIAASQSAHERAKKP